MPSAYRVPRFAFAAVLAVSLSGPSWGQELAVSAVALDAHHYLLGAPLTGGAVALRGGPAGGRFTYRVGGEWLRGHNERTGIPCGGFIQPGTCAPERVRDESRLSGANAGAAVRMLGGERAALALTGDLTVASIHAETRGLTSGRSIDATKVLWGMRVGAEGWWAPWPRTPLALELGAAAGKLTPFAADQVLDGYTPFNDGFSFTRLWVGLTWRGG